MTPLALFKNAVATGAPRDNRQILRKLMSTTSEVVDDRRIRYTISTGSVDRENDTVNVTGWDLIAFRRNPVVLWAHKASELPIGKCVSIGVEGDALKAVVDYLPADVPIAGELAEAVFRMCQTGFLSATSVGFRPLEVEVAKDRMDDDDWWAPLNFLRQELMEFSIVSIPANAEALIDPAERAGAAAELVPAGAVPANLASLSAERQLRRALRRAYA